VEDILCCGSWFFFIYEWESGSIECEYELEEFIHLDGLE
jgi:hypothetical protein